jgi:hypothetical protein
MPLHRIIDHCTPPAPLAQQKIPPGVRPRRDGRVRGYSNSIVEVESVVFYANFGILFALKFFAVSIFYLFANSGNATIMPRLHSNHQN